MGSASALRGQCAIVGVGETALAKTSSVSVRELAVDAALAALADAGLTPHDVDGLIVDDEITPQMMPSNELAATLGIRRTFSVHAPAAGAGQVLAPLLAAMAMEAGQGEVFLCYLALDFGHRESGLARFGYTNEAGDREAFERPFGFVGTPIYYAMAAQRYRHLYGLEEEQLGRVAVAIRNHGAAHPGAQLRRTVTLDDYFESPYIARPLRLLDCCLQTTGAAAFVMTSKERARDLRRPPVYALGAGFAASTASRRHGFTQREEFPHRATARAAERAFEMAGVGPDDVDFAQLQDPYTIQVIMQLEDCGFCGRGEGAAFAQEAGIGLDGRLPVNTHGGQLSHGYLLAMTHVIEAVRQLRGEAGEREVRDAEIGLVSGYGPGENSVLLLGR